MKIYHYNPETGVLLGEDEAQPSPVLVDDEGRELQEPDAENPDHWLIPAYATETAPPAAGKNQQVVWGGDSWSLQAIPTPPPEPPPPSLSERKATMVIRIKTEARYRIESAMPTWKVVRSLTGGPAVGANIQAEAQRLRAVSNTLETQVNAMNAEALDSFDPGDDQHWEKPTEE